MNNGEQGNSDLAAGAAVRAADFGYWFCHLQLHSFSARRTHGEPKGRKGRVSCLVKNLTGRVAGAGDGRRPSERRAEGKSIRMIPDILSSC